MILELSKRAKRINVPELALLVAQSNTGLIKERLIGQLEVGENGNGQQIGKYTSAYYARFKQRIGSKAPSGTVDLKLSGNLYDGIFVDFGNKVEIDSDVEYSRYQKIRYGKEIYELQDENKEDVRFNNSAKTVEAYKTALGL